MLPEARGRGPKEMRGDDSRPRQPRIRRGCCTVGEAWLGSRRLCECTRYDRIAHGCPSGVQSMETKEAVAQALSRDPTLSEEQAQIAIRGEASHEPAAVATPFSSICNCFSLTCLISALRCASFSNIARPTASAALGSRADICIVVLYPFLLVAEFRDDPADTASSCIG